MPRPDFSSANICLTIPQMWQGLSFVSRSKRITFLYSFWHMKDVPNSTQIDGPVFIAPPSQSPARLFDLHDRPCAGFFMPGNQAVKKIKQQKGPGNPCRGLCRPKPAESAGYPNFAAVRSGLCISLIFFAFGQCAFIVSLFFCHISAKLQHRHITASRQMSLRTRPANYS